MNAVTRNRLSLALLGVLALLSPQVPALQVDADARLDVAHSDNIDKSETNEQSDQLITAGLSGTVAEKTGPLTGQATASLRQLDYLDNSFGNQTYIDLNSSAVWEQIRGRLSWRVHDYYSQNQIDNLGVDTPDNVENSNAFGISANIVFPVADRQRVSVVPSFQDFYFETSASDNRRLGVTAGWEYQFRKTITLTADATLEKTNFKNAANSDFSRRNLSGGISGQRAHSNYKARLGFTHIDRDIGTDVDGVSASLDWLVEVTGRSKLRAFVSSDITDSSYEFLNSAMDPGTGDYTNVQTAGDVIRTRLARISYDRSGSAIDTSLWTELRNLEYTTSPNDREVKEVGASLGYRMTPQVSATFQASFNRVNETDTLTDQDTRLLGASIGYRLTRKLGLNFGLWQENRDSNLAGADYDELRISAGLGYKILP